MTTLNIWSVWDRDEDARTFREGLSFEVMKDAHASAMVRDMRALRRREKQYKRHVDTARVAGNRDELTDAKRLLNLCRRIINASQRPMSDTVDHEWMRDRKLHPRDSLVSYDYDDYEHVMRNKSADVSNQVRDAAYPPVLEYPNISLLLPDLPQQ